MFASDVIPAKQLLKSSFVGRSGWSPDVRSALGAKFLRSGKLRLQKLNTEILQQVKRESAGTFSLC